MTLEPVRVLDAALAVLVVEIVVLAWQARAARLRAALLSFLGAGAALLLVARVALVQGSAPWLYALLALGGVMQAWHLKQLWSSHPRPK